ncbi:MAG: hypothetical protein COX19_11770 [Desulfobacterales bacterium CG23_combo_of_CG06-09_8_20_14_all_51_8]|nr:MAG: hypothetical protein COX19_11770 [Desulfobacterales bacterium CG23_combo_of_CG06-09_8_20_14_all_51_8]
MTRIHIDEWPPYSPADQAKKDNVLIAAKLMVNAALTAPSTGGVPGQEAEIAYGQKELELIAREMERLAHEQVIERLKKPFLYEAVMVRESDAVVFLGNKRAHETPMDVGCGLCGGEPNCSFVYERLNHYNGLIDATDRRRETAIRGPVCVIRAHDLGYAIGSALWVAGNNFIDAKSCYSVGLAGRNLDFCMNSEIVVGILLGVASKNPYADTPPNYHLTNLAKQVDAVRKITTITRQIPNHPYHTFDPAKKKKTDNTGKEE